MPTGTGSRRRTAVVADASVIVAIACGEDGWKRCAEALSRRPQVLVSAVNHTEVRLVAAHAGIEVPAGVWYDVAPVDATLAEMAAVARVRFPKLNFGDCFAYALARREGLPLVATDADFRSIDIDVLDPTR